MAQSSPCSRCGLPGPHKSDKACRLAWRKLTEDLLHEVVVKTLMRKHGSSGYTCRYCSQWVSVDGHRVPHKPGCIMAVLREYLRTQGVEHLLVEDAP
jgi:hypothetical protein